MLRQLGDDMKVLQLLPELNQGGVERGTVDMVEGLVNQGHEAYVVSAGGILVEQIEALGGQHFKLPVHRKSLSTLLVIPRLKQLINTLAPDIIHVRSRVPAWVNRLASFGYKEKPIFISTYHGLYSVSAYSRVMTQADQIIAVSNTVKAHMIRHYGVTESKITVIPRGCDTRIFTPKEPSNAWLQDWYTQFPQTQGKKLLTMVSRLSSKKGFEYLLGLLAKLDNDCHGLIVGSTTHCKPRYLAKLKQRINEMNLQDRVTLCGMRQDVAQIYAMSDIVFGLRTEPESFGRTMIEAIQMQTPVIGWDIGGVGEILAELFPEGLVPLKDERTLLAKTKAILGDKSIQPKQNMYTKDGMIQKTLAVYEKVLKQTKEVCHEV